MKIELDPANPENWPKGRINAARLDATTESELAAQQASNDEVAMRKAAGAVKGMHLRFDDHREPMTK